MAAVTRARLGALWRRARPLLPDARDLHVYGGGLLVTLGVALVYRPAAFIAFGALLVYLGLRTTTHPPRRR